MDRINEINRIYELKELGLRVKNFMKVILGIIGLVFLGIVSSMADENAFIKVRTKAFTGYIIHKEYASKNLKDDFRKDVTGFWTPSSDQGIAAQASVEAMMKGPKENRVSISPKYLAHGTKADQEFWVKYFEEQARPYILKHYKEYAVQFVGILVGERRLIFCHYSESHGVDASKVYFSGPSDGGASTWSVEWDVDSKVCSDYQDMGNG